MTPPDGPRPLAAGVSVILSPPVIAAAAGILFVWAGQRGSGAPVSLAVFLLSAVFVPTGWVLFLSHRGRIRGVFTPDGKERTGPLLVGAASCLAGLAALQLLPGHGPVRALLLWYGLFGLLSAALARRWHISLHAAGAWGPAACVGCCFGWPGLLFVPAAAGVTWARYALGAHSARQLWAGASLGAGTAAAVFLIADRLHLLC